jgi:spore germination protein YaaH
MKIPNNYLRVIYVSVFYILASTLKISAQTVNVEKTAQASVGAEKQSVQKKESLFSKLAKKIGGESKKLRQKKADSTSQKDAKYVMQVYGWHPSWLGETSLDYNYNLLTTLSYFSCDIMLNGQKSIEYVLNGWDEPGTTQMISQARADGCRIDLTVKCYSPEVLDSIFNSKEQRVNCINMLTYIISSDQKADGITLAFESIPEGNEIQLTQFVKELYDSLSPKGKTVSIAIPSEDYSNTYQVKELSKYVHQFILMGYNYYNKKSNKPGPVAPLKSGYQWNPYDIKRSVNKYISLGIPKSKLILALPYYGAVWQKDSTEKGGVKYRFKEHLRYNKIAEHTKRTPQSIQYDSVSHSNYYSYNENGKSYVCFYDNARSLAHKYEWAGQQGLAGVGIWALGYDSGHDELWKSLDKKVNVVKIDSSLKDTLGFSDNTAASIPADGNKATDSDSTKPTGDEEPSVSTQMKAIVKNPKVLTAIILTLALFSIVGIILSTTFETVRAKLIITDLSTYLLAHLFLILGFLAFFFMARFMQNEPGGAAYIHINHLTNWIIFIFLFIGIMIQILSYNLFLTHMQKGKLP